MTDHVPIDATIGEVIAQAMRREPQPSVYTAWEGEERTETAYIDGWLSARSYYASMIQNGWPYDDPCLTDRCVFHRGHTGNHAIATGGIR